MALSLEGTVLRFDTNDTSYDNQAKLKISGFKLIGGIDASTVIVRDTDGSGQILWQGRCAIATDLMENVYIRSDRKIHVTFTGTGPILYVYME